MSDAGTVNLIGFGGINVLVSVRSLAKAKIVVCHKNISITLRHTEGMIVKMAFGQRAKHRQMWILKGS